MSQLTVQILTEEGDTISTVAASSGGDKYTNAGNRTFIYLINSDSSTHTVTATAVQTSVNIDGFGKLTKADKVVSVPAGATRWIGPLPQAFNDTTGSVALSYSDVTGMTIAVIRS